MYITKLLLLLFPIILINIVVLLLYVDDIFTPNSNWGVWLGVVTLMSLVCGGTLINGAKYMILVDTIYCLLFAIFVLAMTVSIYFILLIKFSFSFYSFDLLALVFSYILPPLTIYSLKSKNEFFTRYEITD
ncbi:MAG TPA: hypothetical protein DCL21_06010 [Alphaproteobacteria bacterium]|nr:hypothetical protein [Alphaproteobacteria bacterium]